MPGKVKVKIIAGRNLPVMDRSSDTTDAYVEIKLGNTSYKTDVCRKSLNPQWNSEWYRFEMDDAELQDEPLQIRLMDHDTYSANDAIGKVYIDLNPLLLPSSTSSVKSSLLPDSATASSSSISIGNTMSGWFPVYDTMHGIRGEVNIIVKVELFSDFNKFRQSSCGVQFFNSSVIPQGYHAQVIHGLVEELIVSDDPEYQWIDKIRTPRASNEARQTIFLKLSGEVQRKIGLKVLDLGGNAVIGYKQCFDLEGESGIVVRGIGTAATLIRLYEHIHTPRPTMTTEESSVNTNVVNTNVDAGVPPVLSVIPASPSPYHSFLPSTTKKKLLVPKSPRPVHSNSPNRWQPFSEIRSKNKNLGLSTHSLNTDIFDNFSVKSLCEQEDMRGEITSNRKKLFRAISDFPRKRIKALKSNSADGFSFTKRKPKTYACSTALIKSIIDSKKILDSVSEREEPNDNNRMDDSRSVYLDDEHELMRYVDGHLESEGSSLSSDSSSSDVDTSDISSVNISGTEITADIDSEQDKRSNKLSKVESFCNSTGSSTKCIVDSDKKDYVGKPGNPDASSQLDCKNCIESKNSILSNTEKLTNDNCCDVRKAEDSENINSPLDVHVKSQLIDDENVPKSFSKLVEYKETSSEKSQRNVSLQRQNCFDNSFRGWSRYVRRSDTPPLSEMDPYMKFSLDDNMTYTETIFTPQSAVKVTVTQPSFDKKSKSKSVPNLKQSESIVDPEMNESGYINNGTVFKTVHTVDFSSRNLLIGSEFPYPVSSNFECVSNKDVTCSDNPNTVSFVRSHSVENKEQSKSKKPILSSKMNAELGDQIFIPLKDPEPEYENLMQDTDHPKKISQSEKEQFDSNGTQTLVHDLHSNHYQVSSLISDDDHVLKDHDYDKYNISQSYDTTQIYDRVYKKNVDASYNTSADSGNKLTCKQANSVVVPLKATDCVLESAHDQKNFSLQQIFNSNSDRKFDDHNENKFLFCKPNSEGTDHIWIPLKMPEDNFVYNVYQNQNTDYITKIDLDSKQKDYCELDQNHDNCLHKKDKDSSTDLKCDVSLEVDCSSKPILSFEPELPHVPSVVERDNLTANINSNTNCSTKAEQCFEVVTHSATDNILPACVANQANLILPHDPCLVRSHSDCGLIEPCQSSFPPSRSVPEDVTVQQQSSGPSVSVKTSQSPARATINTSIHRRSSDSDLSITPKGNSLTGSDRSSVAGAITRPLPSLFLRPSLYKEASDSLEYPFLTMSKYPPGFILHLGGLIQSRSVKLLERMTNIEEPESRDSWWSELRLEMRSHARALSCNIVLGYSEHTAICDDVCVLSASGTAAVVSARPPEVSSLNSSGVAANLSDTPEGPAIVTLPKQFSNLTTSIDRPDYERQAQATQFKQEGSGGSGKQRHHSDSMEAGPETNILPCNPCHLPYNVKKMPYSVDAPKCGVCRKARVPDVMYCTIEPPDNIPVAGQCCLLQAFVCRPKRDCRAELNAKEISDALPFLEYELHSQLLNKLRVCGMNSVFGLKVQICLGEKMIGALATGTGVLLAGLAPPPAPIVTPGNAFQDDQKLAEIQKKLQESIKQNRDYYQLRTLLNTNMEGDGGAGDDTEESEDDLPEPDLTAGNKDACILVIDDAEDADVITRLIDPLPPDGFHVSATESLPGLEDLGVVHNVQMFTQIWRSKIPPSMPFSLYNKHFHKLLQAVYFKLRRLVPCAIGNVRFLVEMPEPEEMQISFVGMALGLAETERTNRPSRKKLPSFSSSKDMSKKDDPEMIFCLEEDQESSGPVTASAIKPLRPGSPVRSEKHKPKHVPRKEHYGVDITTLSFIPGARIERYVGNLNFFFIRESTSVREHVDMKEIIAYKSCSQPFCSKIEVEMNLKEVQKKLFNQRCSGQELQSLNTRIQQKGGGLSGFVHSFVAEVLAIVRAHITALGGNAMVAYSMCDCILHNNPHKNNGQCLVNVVGDAVYVSYPQE